eukprot:TRINITY_DN5047_c0_g1_i1.p1 TRINITY_DN5047_c0_g1~~TRINITY_DN5047_c0_g1_i1.p1  ORF type:complete len:567 (-),score=97.63 TRINITY_DN5047_c0_g1_i1:111-1811(-)
MYNISKVAKEKILKFFNNIFDSLCRAFTDNDSNVKNGAQLLDRLIKETVSESKGFNVESFIPILRERMNVSNPSVRLFLVGWISVLDSVEGINLIDFLPDFLDGLFLMLSDSSRDLRRQADSALADFLVEIKQSSSGDYIRMMNIVLNYCESKDEFTKLTAINWCVEFIELGKERILEFATDLITIFLFNHSHEAEEIQQVSVKANTALMNLIMTVGPAYDLVAVFDVLMHAIVDPNKWTKLSVLNWIMSLFVKFPDKIEPHLDNMFPALIKMLGDPDEHVVTVDLDVISQISLIEKYFAQLVTRILQLFETDVELLEKNGSLVVKSLCLKLGPERMYRAFSQSLQMQQNPEFAMSVVRLLSTLLLVAEEMSDVRRVLSDISTPLGRDLFLSLYKAWAYNPAALYLLCLHCQAYEHSSALISKLAELEIVDSFLQEVDDIVQYLESPLFAYIRMQLLEPTKYPYLYKSLYGVLMLIPHFLSDVNASASYEDMRNRLTSIATMGLIHMEADVRLKNYKPVKQTDAIDWLKLLPIFETVQMDFKNYSRRRVATSVNWVPIWKEKTQEA